MKELIEYIERSISLSDEIVNDLQAITIEKNVQKGEIILKDNSSKKIQIFVASGCLRAFFKTENGKDHTLQFATKNWWISDYMTLFNKQESILGIESLSHSKIMILNQSELEKLYSKFPKFGLINRINLQNRIAALQKRIFLSNRLLFRNYSRKFKSNQKGNCKILISYHRSIFKTL